MVRIVTDYLDDTVRSFPDKVAFVDDKRSITFAELQEEAFHVATELIHSDLYKKPILVYLEKSIECIVAFSGVSYSGNFYSPLDVEMPDERIEKIVGKLEPAAIITDKEHADEARKILTGGIILIYEDMLNNCVDKDNIMITAKKIVDTDILYILFTSGSTGTPKGVIISHKGIIDLSEWISNCLGFSEETVMANQSPFYFSFSVYEIYQTLKNGATTYIVPQKLFSQPTKLMKYLDDNSINTIIWVPSILMLISTLRALNRPHLHNLKNVFFGAEVFQTKHLNRWMEEYPDVRFVNLYGPTEVTDTCTWYEIKEKIKDDEMIPIGKSCTNKDCFLLDDNVMVTSPGEIGEICMRGSGVAYGYYNDIEKTEEVFVQNPLNKSYKEIIYRTGDLAKYNEKMDMVYICRKDFQIKHMGRRIELGEIESTVSSVNGVEDNCCLYDEKKKKIVLFYSGKIEEKELIKELRNKLPDYMVPGKRIKIEVLPKNLNGKTDRKRLEKKMEENQ